MALIRNITKNKMLIKIGQFLFDQLMILSFVKLGNSEISVRPTEARSRITDHRVTNHRITINHRMTNH